MSFLDHYPWRALSPEPQHGGNFHLPLEYFSKPILTYGATGAGKTQFVIHSLGGLVYGSLASGRPISIGVFDGSGDLTAIFLDILALLYHKYPEHLEGRVILDDPDLDFVTPDNLTQLRPGEDPNEKAQQIVSAMGITTHTDMSVAVRFKRIAFNAVLTAILGGKPITHIPALLMNNEYRTQVLAGITDPTLIDFWVNQYPTSDQATLALVESTLNRFELFIRDKNIQATLEQPSTFDRRAFLQRGGILLHRYDAAAHDEIGWDMLALKLSATRQDMFGRRRRMREDQQTPVICVCDEYQNFLTSDFQKIAREGRKNRTNLLLSTQDTLPPDEVEKKAIYASLFNAAQVLIAFRLGYAQARHIAREIFQPDFDQVKAVDPTSGHVLWRGMEEINEREIRKLTNLPNRHFYLRLRRPPSTHLITTWTVPDFDQLPQMPELRERLMQSIREHYGRPKILAHPATVQIADKLDLSPAPFWGR